jgi:hypothetical protein
MIVCISNCMPCAHSIVDRLLIWRMGNYDKTSKKNSGF